MHNSCTFVGNLVKDPDMRYTPSGTAKTTFTIAVNRDYKKDDGSRDCDFIPCVTWGKLAEICGELLKKGKQVLAEGRLEIVWNETEKKQYINVNAGKVRILGKKEG